jgi:hypothetical protein
MVIHVEKQYRKDDYIETQISVNSPRIFTNNKMFKTEDK